MSFLGRMNSRKSWTKSPDKQDSMTEPSEAMVDLVEIKQEPDIKQEFDIESEPNETCIVTYTYDTSTPADNIFAPIKVEKVDPDFDDGDANGRDEAFDLLDKFGDFDPLNLVNLTAIIRTQPMDRDTECPRQSAVHPIGGKGMAKQRSERADGDGAQVLLAPELDVAESSEKSKSVVEGNRKSRSAPKPNSKQHKCSECDYIATQSSDLKRHNLKHTGEKPFACNHCPKRFTDNRDLGTHLKVHVTKDSLNCSICWQIFATQTEKSNHESTCKQRRYECYVCQAFSTFYISHLKIHMRVHNGIRPYQCDQCQLKFTRKITMKRHMKTHTNPRPLKFRCSVCARNFLEQTGRDQHELNCKRRRYECYVCQSYVTHQKENLQRHMWMHHTDETPWKCSLCVECFPVGFDLKRHLKTVHKQKSREVWEY